MKQYLSPEWLFIPGNHSNEEPGIPFHLDSTGFIDFDQLRETPF